MNAQVQALDFTSFIFAQGEELKTTSLKIAEAFGKRHDHVLRDIRKIISQTLEILNAPKFGEVEYLDAKGESRSMYEMNKDGFMLVVMGYTGEAAMKIKVAYINAFNLMHAKLFPKIEPKPQTLTPAMLRHINKRINWLVKNQCGTTYAGLGGMLLDKFNVNERRAIPFEKYGEVCELLGCEPDVKALQGELLESPKREFTPPAGKVLIDAKEYEALKRPNFSLFPSITLSVPNDNYKRWIVEQNNGTTAISYLPENCFVGTAEDLLRKFSKQGIFGEKVALEMIAKISNATLVA